MQLLLTFYAYFILRGRHRTNGIYVALLIPNFMTYLAQNQVLEQVLNSDKSTSNVRPSWSKAWSKIWSSTLFLVANVVENQD